MGCCNRADDFERFKGREDQVKELQMRCVQMHMMQASTDHAQAKLEESSRYVTLHNAKSNVLHYLRMQSMPHETRDHNISVRRSKSKKYPDD